MGSKPFISSPYEDFQPSIELKEEERSDTLVLNLSGFARNQIKVQIDSFGMLKISGERPTEDNKFSRFRQDYRVPAYCNTNEIRAKFDEGFLHIIMPKVITEVPSSRTTGSEPKSTATPKPPSSQKPATEPKTPTTTPQVPTSQKPATTPEAQLNQKPATEPKPTPTPQVPPNQKPATATPEAPLTQKPATPTPQVPPTQKPATTTTEAPPKQKPTTEPKPTPSAQAPPSQKPTTTTPEAPPKQKPITEPKPTPSTQAPPSQKPATSTLEAPPNKKPTSEPKFEKVQDDTSQKATPAAKAEIQTHGKSSESINGDNAAQKTPVEEKKQSDNSINVGKTKDGSTQNASSRAELTLDDFKDAVSELFKGPNEHKRLVVNVVVAILVVVSLGFYVTYTLSSPRKAKN